MGRLPSAKRYAQAAFGIAHEEGRVEEWFEDLRRAEDLLDEESLRVYLEMPIVGPERKVGVLRGTLGTLSPLVVNLVGLLVSRNALGIFGRIVIEYQHLMDDYLGRERVEVVTAVPLHNQQKERLTRQLTWFLDNKEVVLSTRVDAEVVGGVVTRVGDRLIDASSRGKLLALRRSLAVPQS